MTISAATHRTLSDAEMYQRILASDASFDGRFYFGVVTTGVYCRPSCRVRKPLLRNVRFFAVPSEARAAGLRPCRRCHPDDFAAGEDVERDEVMALVEELRADPARFADVDALVERFGYGATHLFQSFRRVLGQTPAAVLNQARIEHAKRLLATTDESVLAVAMASGYHSVSAFHRRFKLATGVTPQAYRIAKKEAS
jgi:AraC family transcriptional regulator of adaptative response / DNA-3-methyladenine glycosylase II